MIDSWIYTACLCFGLDLAEQERSGFVYGYSVYQVEYSRNLIFTSGAAMDMDRLFNTVVGRTRAAIAAMLAVRDKVIAPLLARLRDPPPRHANVFHDPGIATDTPAAAAA